MINRLTIRNIPAHGLLFILLISESCVYGFSFSPIRGGYKHTISIPSSQSYNANHYYTAYKSFSSPHSTMLLRESSTDDIEEKKSVDAADDEIDRLRSMAAKLRAEAAALEAEKARELADAAEIAFRKFDTNQDGVISLDELKAGLEKTLKTELPDRRVEQLMKEFDTSGDGALQLDEFVTTEKFRNRLESLSREEREAAVEAERKAKEEEKIAAMAEAKLELINDREPTGTDKLVSLVPYVFPLLDGLQYGRFLINSNAEEPNIFIVALAVIYGLYRTIPFSGFISFIALNTLSNNVAINRLIRYNMQQAIFLDISLFFPGLLTGLISIVLQGNQLPSSVTELGNDAIFLTLLLTVVYCMGSSLLGIVPDKIPFISGVVSKRMPAVDDFVVDSDGNIKLKDETKQEEDKKED